MTPARCGTGRTLAALTPGDRAVVDDYRAYLRGDLAYDRGTDEFVPIGRAGEPGVVTHNDTRRETR